MKENKPRTVPGLSEEEHDEEQEMSPKDEETAVTGETNAALATDERGTATSEPVASSVQQERPLPPPSSGQPAQPTAWQSYSPATPPPWSELDHTPIHLYASEQHAGPGWS